MELGKATEKEIQIIQSYMFTAAKYDYSIYEKRIIYKLIECVQHYVNHEPQKGFTIVKDLFDTRTITIPVLDFYKDEKDRNYKEVKIALDSLAKKRFSYEIIEDELPTWYNVGIINQSKIKKGDCTVEINDAVWKVLFDFSRGYRKFEIKLAMSFKSVFTMRLYELLNTKSVSITYSIKELKEMFVIENKYKNFADFERSVIIKAKKELDLKSPKSFNYKVNYVKNKSVSITFFPYELSNNKSENEKDSNVSPNWFLNRQEIEYLEINYDFTIKEIKSHNTLFKRFKQTGGDLMKFLSIIKRKALDKENPKGYIISSLKNEINQKQTSNEDIIKVDSIVSDLTKNFTQK